MGNLKGQYIAVNELILFGICALIAVSAAVSISAIIIPIEKQAQKAQYYLIANLVSLAATKTYLCSNYGECTLTLEIPERLANDKYKIIISGDEVKVCNFAKNPCASSKLPYLGKSFTGFATSSSKYFVIHSDGNLVVSKW